MKTKKANSDFLRDLSDPLAGTHSGLYNTVAPIMRQNDDENSKDLKEQVRQGLVGLEYLTGAKKNKVNTFFDEHPVEAVTTDLLSKSPMLGTVLAGGGLLSNLRTQKKNFDRTMMAEMARSKNPKDATNPENLLNSDRADIANVLGSKNSPERLETIDRLSGKPSGTGFLDEYRKLQAADPSNSFKPKAQEDYKKVLQSPRAHKDLISKKKALADLEEQQYQKAILEHQKKIQDLFQRAAGASESSNMRDYANFHESLKKLKEKGGLKRYFGEGLHDTLGDSGISNFIKKHILPQKGQAAIDLLERHGINAAHPNIDTNLIKSILTENLGSEVSNETLNTFLDPKKQKSSIINLLRRHRFPLYAGAGLATAGTGLYQLMKAIQNQRYPEDKQQEWKRNALKAQGRFREAEQI